MQNPIEYRVFSRAIAVIGGRDSLQTSKGEEMFNHLAPRFEKLDRVFLKDSDHELEPEADSRSRLLHGAGSYAFARAAESGRRCQ